MMLIRRDIGSSDRVFALRFIQALALIIGVACVQALLPRMSVAAEPTEMESVLTSVETLSRAKTQAESRVKLIKALLDDGEITKTDYRRILVLYSDAQAGANAGIDRMLFQLEALGEMQEQERFNDLASRTAEDVETFLVQSDLLVFGEDRSGAIAAGVSFAETLTNAFMDIWKTLRGERNARHAKVIERIESLRWKAFDDV